MISFDHCDVYKESSHTIDYRVSCNYISRQPTGKINFQDLLTIERCRENTAFIARLYHVISSTRVQIGLL